MKPETMPKAYEAFTMRHCGYTFEEIGRALGTGRAHARTLVWQWERRMKAEQALRDSPRDLFALAIVGRIPSALVNALASCEGVQTVEDLARLTRGEVLRTPGVGRRGLAAVERLLAEHGMKLADRSARTTCVGSPYGPERRGRA